MKHLVIPTDFSLRSLEPIRAAVRHFADEPFSITLVHLLYPPTDILDGLRMGYRSSVRPEVPGAFTLAVESLRAVLIQQVHSIKIDIRYGSTVAYARNLLEHLGADAVLYNPQMPFELPVQASYDPRPVLRRAMPDGVIAVGESVTAGKPVMPAATTAERPARAVGAGNLEPSLS